MNDETFVPIEEVAKHFAVSTSTVRVWIRQGLIPALKLGDASNSLYRFKISEVEKALRSLSGGELVREETDGSLTVRQPVGASQMALNFNLEDDI